MSKMIHPTRVQPRIQSTFASGTVLLGVCSIAALWLLFSALNHLAWLLNHPYPTDGLEGTLLHEARLLWSGQPLYQPLELYTFVSAPYPPLHPLFVGFADQFAGPHVFWSARLVAVIATLVIAATIVILVRRVSRSWLAGLLGAAVFLSAPPVLLWGARVKPDLFALQWTTLGLCFSVGAFQSWTENARPRAADRSWRWLIPALICFWLAFLTKQTAVMAPFATGLALLTADLRSWRHAERSGYIWLPVRWRTAAFGLSYLGGALGILLLLDLITAGQFTAHISGLHRSEWWSMHLVRKYVRLLLPYWPLMLLGLALIIQAIRDDRALVPVCYGLVAPITLMGAAEIGANHNHLLETILALSIAGGCAAGWAARMTAERRLAGASLLVLFFIQIVLAQQPQPWFVGELAPPDPPERFINFIRNTPGEILADDVGLLLMAGKPIRYDDPSTMGPAAVSGVWDQRGLIEDIAQQRFSAIMIPEDVIAEPVPYDGVGRWTTEVRMAIREHYELKFRDRINTYAPKSAPYHYR